MRALVIGADGFAGRWLVKHLAECGDVVLAGVGPRYVPPLPFADEATPIDVRDLPAVEALVERSRPDTTYYLAGIAQRGKRDAFASSAGVTVTGSLNTLIALAKHAPRSKLVLVSSGYVYPSSSHAHNEDSVLAPTDAYAATKLAAEDVLRRLAPVVGLEMYVARPFNHIGPGQSSAFLVPSVAIQLRDVAAGLSSHISVGTVSDIRDFSDVRDVVRGYRLIATVGQAGSTYNVSSGEGHVISDVIEIMTRLAGVRTEVQSAPTTDKAGRTSLIGDPSRLVSLGWSREFTLEDSLRDALVEHMPGLARGASATS